MESQYKHIDELIEFLRRNGIDLSKSRENKNEEEHGEERPSV